MRHLLMWIAILATCASLLLIGVHVLRGTAVPESCREGALLHEFALPAYAGNIPYEYTRWTDCS